MAFKVARGLVLRTTTALKVGHDRIVAGTRVKAILGVNRTMLKVKIQDPRYPQLRGEWLTTSFENVMKAGRSWPRAGFHA